MFSGIVEEVGKVASAVEESGCRKLRISAHAIVADLRLGDSISCGGVCLTVTNFGRDWFSVDAVAETLRRTKLGQMKAGDDINLERALRVSDRLGGHLVSGHVDGFATVKSIKQEGTSKFVEFALSAQLEPLFVEKGSVTVDGVSLTVAKVTPSKRHSAGAREFTFAVALIPHTLGVTTLGQLKVGDQVNIEADVIGKYIVNLVSLGYGQNINKGGVTLPMLAEHGYT